MITTVKRIAIGMWKRIPVSGHKRLIELIPGKNKKRNLIAAACLLLAVIIYLAAGLFSAGIPGIPLFTVKKDKLYMSLTESGELNALNAVSITTPRIRGNLKIVSLVTEGIRIKKDDVLIQFDPTEALNSVREAEARLEAAVSDRKKLEANHKSNLTRIENDVKNAELTFELSKLNMQQMKFEAEIKQREAELQHKRNELNYVRAKQDLESARIVQRSEMNKMDIDVSQRKAELDKAKSDLQQLTISAPKDGLVVYETNWSTGRKISTGDSPWPGMALISLPDLSVMQSTAYINEVDVSRIHKGLPVKVTLDAFRDSTFDGTISNVASLGKNKEGSTSIKVFEINITVNSQSEILKPGMTTSNKILIGEMGDVISIPHEAVFEKNGRQIVYVKKRSAFEERDVVLGAKGEDRIVVERGLKPGEEIALLDPAVKQDEKESAAPPASGDVKSNVK